MCQNPINVVVVVVVIAVVVFVKKNLVNKIVAPKTLGQKVLDPKKMW